MNRDAAVAAIADFLRALGHAPEGELADTPALVAEAWQRELLSGYDADPRQILVDGSIPADAHAGVVVVRDLAVATTCPHHLMPAHGRADVAFLPVERVAGFGAVARALGAVTRRLVLQETAGTTMARLLIEALGARGAAVRLRMRHTCLIVRGARESGAEVETLALAGTFDGSDRDLALGILGR